MYEGSPVVFVVKLLEELFDAVEVELADDDCAAGRSWFSRRHVSWGGRDEFDEVSDLPGDDDDCDDDESEDEHSPADRVRDKVTVSDCGDGDHGEEQSVVVCEGLVVELFLYDLDKARDGCGEPEEERVEESESLVDGVVGKEEAGGEEV